MTCACGAAKHVSSARCKPCARRIHSARLARQREARWQEARAGQTPTGTCLTACGRPTYGTARLCDHCRHARHLAGIKRYQRIGRITPVDPDDVPDLPADVIEARLNRMAAERRVRCRL